MTVEVGATAPEFTLRDQDGQDVSLSSFRGSKNVVLLFYPLTFTNVCRGELGAIRDELATFQNDSVQLLAVSVDSPQAHRAWAEQQGYTFPLLSAWRDRAGLWRLQRDDGGRPTRHVRHRQAGGRALDGCQRHPRCP